MDRVACQVRRVFVVALVALAGLLAAASEALASGWSMRSGRPSASAGAAPTISFASSPGNSVGWVKGIDAPGDTDGQAIRLSIPTAGSAAVDFGNVGSSPPSSPPSFWFRPAHPGLLPFSASASVGVSISFSDGITVSSFFQAPWFVDAWALVGGPLASWSTPRPEGGSHYPCEFGGTYQGAIACPVGQGATVTRASIVADFGGPGTGPDVFVDDLLYDGAPFTTGGPGTVVSVANPWPPPSLVGIARVNRRTGRGTVRADCPTAWRGPCFFALALAVNRNGVRVGTVTGTVWGRFGKVAVHLNRKGRALLRAKGTIRLIVSGTWPGGTPVTAGTRLAVKAVRRRA